MSLAVAGTFAEGVRAVAAPGLVRQAGRTALSRRPAGYAARMRTIPTAPVAAASFVVSYAVVVTTDSRPLGGAVLALGGLWCIHAWLQRHDARTATTLGLVGLGLFVASHLLALVVGAWPSVLVVAGVMGGVAWVRADSVLPTQAGPQTVRFRS